MRPVPAIALALLLSTDASASDTEKPCRSPEGVGPEQLAKLGLESLKKCLDAVEDRDNDQKHRVRLERSVRAFATGDLKLEGQVGYTDADSRLSGPGIPIPVKLDNDTTVSRVTIGWFEKPLLRDFYLLLWGDEKSGLERLQTYRDREDEFFRWGFLDAVTVDAKFGYGTEIRNPGGEDNFESETGSQFYVGVTYTIPIERFFGFEPFDE